MHALLDAVERLLIGDQLLWFVVISVLPSKVLQSTLFDTIRPYPSSSLSSAKPCVFSTTRLR